MADLQTTFLYNRKLHKYEQIVPSQGRMNNPVGNRIQIYKNPMIL